MRTLIALALPLLLLSAAAHGQSTITLEDFDLKRQEEPAPSTTATDSQMETCLLERENCDSTEFKSSKSFSINDVVNLGIIDREEVKTEPASTGANAAAETQTLPSIDIEVLFDYDSDALRPDQYPKLVELANLLKGERFSGFRYAFLGHSDAKGSFAYNQDLSQRRARTVSEFVANVSGLPNSRMITRGLGPAELKTPGDPYGPANRRVQLVLIPVK